MRVAFEERVRGIVEARSVYDGECQGFEPSGACLWVATDEDVVGSSLEELLRVKAAFEERLYPPVTTVLDERLFRSPPFLVCERGD